MVSKEALSTKENITKIIDQYIEEMPSKIAGKMIYTLFDKIYLNNPSEKSLEEVFENCLETAKAQAENPSDEVKVDEEDKSVTNHPKRYLNQSGIEAIDIIEILVTPLRPDYAFNIGTAVKYLTRLGRKDAVKKEWEKVAWYFNRTLNNSGIFDVCKEL